MFFFILHKTQAFDRVIPSIGLYRSPYRQLTRSSRIETAVLPELQGYEPPNKRETISGLKKTWKHRKKSDDDDNVELDEQSAEELISESLPEWIHVINNTQNSPQTCAQLQKKLEGQRATWILCKIKKNISLTQIYSFPQGKLELSLAKPDKDKYSTRDKKQHNLQQLIKQPGPA